MEGYWSCHDWNKTQQEAFFWLIKRIASCCVGRDWACTGFPWLLELVHSFWVVVTCCNLKMVLTKHFFLLFCNDQCWWRCWKWCKWQWFWLAHGGFKLVITTDLHESALGRREIWHLSCSWKCFQHGADNGLRKLGAQEVCTPNL